MSVEQIHDIRDTFAAMMLEFLKTYNEAENLDDHRFDQYFPDGVNRADFMLFQRRVICEVKDFEAINIPAAVERVWKRRAELAGGDGLNVARNIRDEVRSKGKQINATKSALGLRKALGLIIVENHRPTDLSALVLIEVVNRELQRALGDVDAVLCVDFKNQFTSADGAIRLAQIVPRRTRRGRRLTKLVDRFMADFSRVSGITVHPNHNLAVAEHGWHTDAQGKFVKYHARIEFESRDATWRETLRPLLQFLAKWAWLIGLALALCHWLLRRAHLI
jgi:hypothetical protein